jgi:nucleoside phosphorylase
MAAISAGDFSVPAWLKKSPYVTMGSFSDIPAASNRAAISSGDFRVPSWLKKSPYVTMGSFSDIPAPRIELQFHRVISGYRPG